MPPLSETPFSFVDYVAQRLHLVSYALMIGIFAALCVPTHDKKRDIIFLAKLSRVLLVAYTAFFLVDFALYPGASVALFANSIWQLFYVIFGTDPLFWFIYGERALMHDVNEMYNRIACISMDKSQTARIFGIVGQSFASMLLTLGGGYFYIFADVVQHKSRNQEREFDIPVAVVFLVLAIVLVRRAYYKRRELIASWDFELPTESTSLLK